MTKPIQYRDLNCHKLWVRKKDKRWRIRPNPNNRRETIIYLYSMAPSGRAAAHLLKRDAAPSGADEETLLGPAIPSRGKRRLLHPRSGDRPPRFLIRLELERTGPGVADTMTRETEAESQSLASRLPNHHGTWALRIGPAILVSAAPLLQGGLGPWPFGLAGGIPLVFASLLQDGDWPRDGAPCLPGCPLVASESLDPSMPVQVARSHAVRRLYPYASGRRHGRYGRQSGQASGT